jgi:hypothetical protein
VVACSLSHSTVSGGASATLLIRGHHGTTANRGTHCCLIGTDLEGVDALSFDAFRRITVVIWEVEPSISAPEALRHPRAVKLEVGSSPRRAEARLELGPRVPPRSPKGWNNVGRVRGHSFYLNSRFRLRDTTHVESHANGEPTPPRTYWLPKR